MENRQHAKRRRPVLRGCLIVLALGLVLAAGALFLLYRQVVEYTDPAPAAVPVKEVRPGEYERLERRWRSFARREARGEAREVTFTADDLNAAISGSNRPQVRQLAGRVHFRIEDDRLFVDTSIRLEEVPLVSERFFNGTVEVAVEMEDGRLRAQIVDARTADGRDLPGALLEPVRVGVNHVLERHQERHRLPAKQVEIRDGKVVLRR